MFVLFSKTYSNTDLICDVQIKCTTTGIIQNFPVFKIGIESEKKFTIYVNNWVQRILNKMNS